MSKVAGETTTMHDELEVPEQREPEKPFSLTDAVTNRVESIAEERLRGTRNLKILRNVHFKRLCATIQALPAWKSEVASANFWMWGETVEINVSLRKELEAPRLPRELILAGHARRLEKRRAYSGASLIVNGDLIVPKGCPRVKIEIRGYVPATCRVEYEDVEVPARIERRSKIVCDPNASPQGENQSAVEGEITLEG